MPLDKVLAFLVSSFSKAHHETHWTTDSSQVFKVIGTIPQIKFNRSISNNLEALNTHPQTFKKGTISLNDHYLRQSRNNKKYLLWIVHVNLAMDYTFRTMHSFTIKLLHCKSSLTVSLINLKLNLQQFRTNNIEHLDTPPLATIICSNRKKLVEGLKKDKISGSQSKI